MEEEGRRGGGRGEGGGKQGRGREDCVLCVHVFLNANI